jgi:hypothetical protein
MHHLIADGWSYYFIAEELGAVYESLMKGEHAEERPLERTFEDYLRWQSEMLAGPGRVQLESYWLGKLSGDLPALRIPTDFPRPERLSHDGASVNFFISEEKTRLVRDFAKSEGKTIYSVLLTAYFALLRRYSGQRDIIVATMTTGRNETSFANTLGYLSGTLPLRLNITGDMTLKALLQCVFSEVIDSFKHQDYPYGLVLEKLGIPLTSEVRNIFQTMFVLQKSHIKETEALLGTWNGSWSLWHGIETRLAPLPNMGCWFDFDMEIFEIQNCLHGRLTYSSDLFREETIARMCRCFETIVDAMAADADQDIDSIVFP